MLRGALIAVLSPSLAFAAEGADPLGPVAAVVERVIDGDTVRMRARVWLDQEIDVAVRIAGVDAPELFRPKCAAEKELAIAAKAFVADFLDDGFAVLSDVRHDKYAGRVVASLANGAGADLGAALVAAGLAVEGESGAWCATS